MTRVPTRVQFGAKGRLRGLLVLAVALVGCGPTVGDECGADSQCGTTLTCDTTVPQGYCLRTPCRAGECPPEAICVDFGADVRACMRSCSAETGCREGLVCRSDLLGQKDRLEAAAHSFCGRAP